MDKKKKPKSNKPPSIFKLFFRELKHDYFALVGLVLLTIILITIFIGALIIDGWQFGGLTIREREILAPRVLIEGRHDVMRIETAALRRLPISPAASRELVESGALEPQITIFGFDLGRNQYHMLFVAARNSLILAFGVTFFSFILGVIIGIISGFYGGRTDNIIMRITDTWSMIPFLMVVIVLIVIFGRTVSNFILFFTLFTWVGRARLLRAASLQQRQLDYISASKTLGTRNFTIIVREMLPNLVDVTAADFVLTLAASIGIETGLSLLGFGLGWDFPSLGVMMQNAINPLYLARFSDFWFAWVPPLALVIIMMLCVNFVGNALQRVSDPKQRFA